MDGSIKIPKGIVLAVLVLFLSSPLLAQPELSASEEISRTGYFQIKWRNDLNGMFVLQQDTTSWFGSPKTIYSGEDTARSISGLLNGDYYYRVRIAGGEWSRPVVVKVEHYDLSTAFVFLGLGAIVFLATATLIVRGHIAHRNFHKGVDG